MVTDSRTAAAVVGHMEAQATVKAGMQLIRDMTIVLLAIKLSQCKNWVLLAVDCAYKSEVFASIF